ncbi:NUDIX domain-containing protein [Jongsikchunia kroppenstedtii]|uniref:NUDIX domain-containing protein n=1 Tax=Jongsikchunia kroppenstedtii TaxID=1121721 RepID=UPI00037C4FB9|nr:NUDIX domain-containing protein [Jongsikchunia kroppenstedtii]
MTRQSAGLLLFRRSPELQVLIGHMGGPFWARKDARGWSIPKGEYTTEEPLVAAEREFAEELGSSAPGGTVHELGSTRQSGKVVTVFAREGDFDADHIESNTFSIEWPRGSGEQREFPEIDRAGWFDMATAREKLVAGQVVFLDRLAELLA